MTRLTPEMREVFALLRAFVSDAHWSATRVQDEAADLRRSSTALLSADAGAAGEAEIVQRGTGFERWEPSPPAPARRDEELDRLLDRFAHAWFEACEADYACGTDEPGAEAKFAEWKAEEDEAREAIQQHVAQRVAEAEQKYEEAVEDAWSVIASVTPWSGQSAEWRERADRFRHVHILPREPSANKRAAKPGEVGK